MKNLKKISSKICMLGLATVMPLSVTGAMAGILPTSTASADTTASSYYKSYMETVAVTNKNFNSSTVNSISSSPSGWTRQVSNGKSTAGIINVGNNFSTNKTSNYYLSVNPSSKASDNQILMINSKTSKTDRKTAREGYKSSSITLDANSFYSFQVSFKSDTNYEEKTSPVQRGNLDSDTTVYQSNFNGVAFNDYVQLTYKNTSYYVQKKLESKGTLSGLSSQSFFYEDDTYLGFVTSIAETSTPIYVKKADLNKISINANTSLLTDPTNTNQTTTLGEDYQTATFEEYDDYFKFEKDGIDYYVLKTKTTVSFVDGCEYFKCNLVFQPNNTNNTTGTYKALSGEEYYSKSTEYDSLNEYGVGSIYISNFKDDNGNDIELKFEKVCSTSWTTFYFFIATGNQSQTVNLELWLGGKTFGMESTGVVFFDDVNVQKYSENLFYETYLKYKDEKFYTQDSQSISSVKFESLTTSDTIEVENGNFDFEDDSGNKLNNWKKTGTGAARILSLSSNVGFEAETGYSFVGSNLKVDASFDDEGNLTIKENKNALALWVENGYVEATSTNIDIKTHGYYKISAYFKISELDGTLYLNIKENDSLVGNISQYTLSSGSASATANGSSSFTNNYGVIDIYVKGSDLYNSSINIGLSLGKEDETVTGCVVFDDVTISDATYEEYSNATNKVELGAITGTNTLENGYFNATENTSSTYPLTPAGWTIKNDGNLTYGGVINTKATEYDYYKTQYQQNKDLGDDNPYLWASFANPMNSNDSTAYSDNILMLYNRTSNAQTVTSPTFELSGKSYYQISFNYKTMSTQIDTTAKFGVKLYNEDGLLLFTKEDVNATSWKTFDIFVQTFKGAEKVYLQIDFGTDSNKTIGFAYFDNFELKSITVDEYPTEEENKNKVDLTDYYINLPTTTITENLQDFKSEAYTTSANEDGKKGGMIKSSALTEDFSIDGDEKNVYMISLDKTSSYTIQSKYSFDLTADNYYKLTFKLKTKFLYQNYFDVDLSSYNYGVTVGLTGFDYMTNLVSNEEYQEYTIYFFASEEASANLYIALISDDEMTTGTIVLYDVNFEEIASDDEAEIENYNNTKTAMEGTDYNVNESRVMSVSNASEESADEETNEDDTNSATENNDLTWALLISTIITAVAIILAVVCVALRKIKLKKIEIKRKESYDRKGTLHKDKIRQLAEQERDAKVNELQDNINKFQTELDTLEKEHKEKVVALRKEDNKQVSKATEKEFKQFAQKRTVLVEKIDVLNKQLEDVKSPDYLLSLERKKYAESEAKQKELAKSSKKEDKKSDNLGK